MKSELTQIIKSKDFNDLISDVNETILDSILDDSVLKDIPIFGLLFKGKNLISTIQDKFFIKKLFTFLKQLEQTSNEDRKRETEKIDNDPNYRTKVGEKLLFIINEADDSEKAEYIGKLYKEFINKNLHYDDFIRAVNCINKTNIIDLNHFINERSIKHILENLYENYIFTGLITQKYYDALETAYKNSLIPYEKSGIKYQESHIGKKIRNLLNESLNKIL
ncbi:hypothetical protein H9Q08_01390 [Chryseobacterium sp. PS-8]|uniref:DUF262 domain-containing protein n=1 Tax=Chryseobacterium indicum TaxID=2766954 RepID=A0ABS9C202_9FLAO|nr:hypothetical protein [Chryseobacterium sp. PS-8]MCF2217955.1 hypothetical protein [Chryseobacterium sp. PS-8]